MSGRAAPGRVSAPLDWGTGPQIELHLPSIAGWERVAVEVAAAAARLVGMELDRIEDVKTAVAEATLNAIEHGNAFDVHRIVLVALVARADGLEVRVQDEGHRLFALPATAEPPSLLDRVNGTSAPRGWGLFLIRSLMDEVDVAASRHGMVLRMVALRTGMVPR